MRHADSVHTRVTENASIGNHAEFEGMGPSH